jgi:thiamine-phosphate pyrophosphorylase
MPVDFKLYLITDRKVAAKPLPEAVRLALEGGVRAVQLREKDLPIRDLLALAQELRSITREFGAKLFINDRVDVAVAVGADGVHLGGQSMPASAVRKIAGDTLLIGVSTHTFNEARVAEKEGADFITYGPVFATPSKAQYGPPVGIDALTTVKRDIHLPVYAIGGMQGGRLSRVFGTGCTGVALISAILGADDIRASAKRLQDEIAMITKINSHT